MERNRLNNTARAGAVCAVLACVWASVWPCAGVLLISSDPVADACSPLCTEESSLEVQCARAKGCYHPAVKNNSALYSDCLTHCWSLAGQCFDLCSEQFDPILRQCYTKCNSSSVLAANPDCIMDCFSDVFAEMKAKTLNYTIQLPKKTNSTSEIGQHGDFNFITPKQKATARTLFPDFESTTQRPPTITKTPTTEATNLSTMYTTDIFIRNYTQIDTTETTILQDNSSLGLQVLPKLNISSFYPLEPPGKAASVVSGGLDSLMQFILDEESEQLNSQAQQAGPHEDSQKGVTPEGRPGRPKHTRTSTARPDDAL